MEEFVCILNQGPTNFNKFGSHLEILGTRRVTCTKNLMGNQAYRIHAFAYSRLCKSITVMKISSVTII
jgi:hypothetical protein